MVFVFQYRKRYEITCDKKALHGEIVHYKFQYRKRYEITCDANPEAVTVTPDESFNTASGMRSHVTGIWAVL